MTVTNSEFHDNSSTGGGGAIATRHEGDVTIIDSVFHHNQNDDFFNNEGGAISMRGPFDRVAGNLTVIDSLFHHNLASGAGGAIRTQNSKGVSITNSTFHDNTTLRGCCGAVRIGGGVGDVIITESVFHSNQSSPANSGGAIVISSRDITMITDSTFHNNEGGTSTGAISLGEGQHIVTGSTFHDNRAGSSGGAISARGDLSIINSTFQGNRGGVNPDTPFTRGGGAMAVRGSGSLVLLHVTMAENEAPQGANLLISDEGRSFSSFGSVVALPIDGRNCLLAEGTAVNSQGYNFADDNSCGLIDDTDIQDGDPLLRPLDDNGGSTPTRLPDVGSPLIDAIPVGSCHPSVLADQRGLQRPQGDVGCDIGAVEVFQLGNTIFSDRFEE